MLSIKMLALLGTPALALSPAVQGLSQRFGSKDTIIPCEPGPTGGPSAAARALSAQPRPYEGPYYFTPGGAFPLGDGDDRNPPRGPGGGGHPASIALPEERPSTEDAMLFPDPVAALDAAAALRADQDARRLYADDDVAKAA